jgi:hypothetical protein
MACVPYASVVGSLMYAMVCTRPDISHVVGVLRSTCRHLGKSTWIVVKRVFRYLHGTTEYAICYQGKPKTDREVNVHGFVDANRMEILIEEGQPMDMCLECSVEKSIG